MKRDTQATVRVDKLVELFFKKVKLNNFVSSL